MLFADPRAQNQYHEETEEQPKSEGLPGKDKHRGISCL